MTAAPAVPSTLPKLNWWDALTMKLIGTVGFVYESGLLSGLTGIQFDGGGQARPLLLGVYMTMAVAQELLFLFIRKLLKL